MDIRGKQSGEASMSHAKELRKLWNGFHKQMSMTFTGGAGRAVKD